MRKKIAMLLSIVMIIASMPITAFAANNKVFALLDYDTYYELGEDFSEPPSREPKIIDGNTVTDLVIEDVDLYSYGIGLPLKNKATLENVIFDDSYVEPYIFKGFSNVKNVMLTPAVDTIDDFVFEDTAITEITIPSSVSTVYNYAFENMPKLTKINNESQHNFNVCIGGVYYDLMPQSTTEFDLRLEKSVFNIDKKGNQFSLQLKALGNENKVVTFTPTSVLPDGWTLSESGLLSGTNNFETTSVDLDINTDSANASVTIDCDFYDSSIKNGINPFKEGFEKDPYSYDAPKGTFGNDLVTPFEPYTIKFNDTYGKLFEFEATEKESMDNLSYYVFGNEVTIFSSLTGGEDIEIYALICSEEKDIKDSARHIDVTNKLPYSNVGKFEKTDLRIPNYSQGMAAFADAYKLHFVMDDVISIKINDVDKYTDIQLGIFFEGIDIDNDYVCDFFTFNSNNFDSTGENKTLYMDEYLKEGNLYIMPMQGSKDGIGSNYKVEIDKHSKYKNFPAKVTLDEKPLDFVANPDSVTDKAGKYSWNNATKTLTLEDGFYIKSKYNTSRNPAIVLPGDATVVVKGNAGIDSSADGIYFNNPQRTLNSKIVLEKGARLNLETSYDAIKFESKTLDIIGTPDAKGALPKLNIHTNDEGIETKLNDTAAGIDNISKLNIKNIEIDLYTDDECIELDNGVLKAENIKGSLYSESQEGIYTDNYGFTVPENQNGIEIVDSNIVIETSEYDGEEALESETGNIKIKNTNLSINSLNRDRKAMFVDDYGGDMIIENSNIKIVADGTGMFVADGKLDIKDSKLAIIADNELMKASEGINITGVYELYDFDNKLVYKGELQNLIKQFDYHGNNLYHLELLDDEGDQIFINGAVSSSLTVIKIGDVKVSTDKNTYKQGENIKVLVEVPEYDGNERYQPVSWEVLGTDLKGNYEKDSTKLSIPTKSLKPGEYTVKIKIVKQKMLPDGKWVNITDSQGKEDVTFKTVKISVLAAENNNIKSPETGAELSLTFGVVLMLGLSLSLVTVVNRKRKTDK